MNRTDPTPPLCERCWSPIQPGEPHARLGQIASANMRGDVTWDYVYLHPTGCAPTPQAGTP